MSDATARRSHISIVIFTIFLDMLGIGILLPVIPQLLANPESPHYLLPAGWSLEQGYLLLGLLTAAYPIAQFFAAPILGQLSDKAGRRPVLAFSLAGTALSYVLFALAILWRDIPLLFFSRILDGITGGNISVAQAAIADVSDSTNRAKNFGLMGAAFGLGFIIGPFIGGKLADPSVLPWFNAATPFWFAAILSVLNMLFVIFWFGETNLHRTTGKLTWSKSLKNIADAFRLKELRMLFLTNFLYVSGFTFFTTFFGVYLIAQFSFSEGNIGDLFAYIGLWIVFTQAVVTRLVAKRYGERSVLNVAMPITGILMLFLLIPWSWAWLLLTVPVFAIFNGLTQANFMAFLSHKADPRMQGEILGINASVAALGQALPPVLSGLIAARFAAVTPLFVAAAVIIVAGAVFVAAHRPSR